MWAVKFAWFCNLNDRLRHHKGGFTHSTKRFGDVKLVLKQKFPSLEKARYIEKKLKNLKRKDYLKKIIEDGYIKLQWSAVAQLVEQFPVKELVAGSSPACGENFRRPWFFQGFLINLYKGRK